MVSTKDAHRAGTKSAVGTVGLRIPLEDPKALGNMGLEGYDEDTVARRCPNAGLARSWAERYRPQEGTEVDYALVEVVRWEADGWDDAEYGWVRDATQVTETKQYGYPPTEAGAVWHWDEPYREDRP